MVRENWVQSQLASYQRLLKWYFIPPCLTFSYIRSILKVKLSNPGKRLVTSPTPRCSSSWKGSHLVALDYGHPRIWSPTLLLLIKGFLSVKSETWHFSTVGLKCNTAKYAAKISRSRVWRFIWASVCFFENKPMCIGIPSIILRNAAPMA